MQAAVIQAPLRMNMESRPPPLLGPGEVLVGVKSVGVCAGPIVWSQLALESAVFCWTRPLPHSSTEVIHAALQL